MRGSRKDDSNNNVLSRLAAPVLNSNFNALFPSDYPTSSSNIPSSRRPTFSFAPASQKTVSFSNVNANRGLYGGGNAFDHDSNSNVESFPSSQSQASQLSESQTQSSPQECSNQPSQVHVQKSRCYSVFNNTNTNVSTNNNGTRFGPAVFNISNLNQNVAHIVPPEQSPSKQQQQQQQQMSSSFTTKSPPPISTSMTTSASKVVNSNAHLFRQLSERVFQLERTMEHERCQYTSALDSIQQQFRGLEKMTEEAIEGIDKRINRMESGVKTALKKLNSSKPISVTQSFVKGQTNMEITLAKSSQDGCSSALNSSAAGEEMTLDVFEEGVFDLD